jgi:hypothetical protein
VLHATKAASVSSIGTSTSWPFARALPVQQGGEHGREQRHAGDLVRDQARHEGRRAVLAPTTAAKPLAAWMISSKAGRARCGPSCPKPVATA